jgi:hypothetical protein
MQGTTPRVDSLNRAEDVSLFHCFIECTYAEILARTALYSNSVVLLLLTVITSIDAR